MDIFHTMLDIVFPDKCLSCRKTGNIICAPCFKNLPETERETSNFVHPVFDYRDKIVQKMIWMLKYGGKKRVAKKFAGAMFERITKDVREDLNRPILVPIPLSLKRLRERGFNQAELIAKEIWKLDSGKNFDFIPNMLVKIKNTESQTKIKNRRKRLMNLNSCFAVKNPELVQNRTIILIDDVATTGATMSEAKKTLISEGAQKVLGFVIAH